MASLQNGNQKGMKEVFKLLTCITQFGINMLVPTVLCFLLGLWLDKQLGTSFLVVILFFVGAAAGARNVYRLVKKYLGNDGENIV
ncbi:MAG: AtpZ/AtpI family protein [Lachnospiraceae bacterium]|nr:AtpZ/AtpI family protein [Lachnospiraceae bacterium]